MNKLKYYILTLLLIFIFSGQSEAKEVKPLFGLNKFIYNEASDLLTQSWTELEMSDEAAKIYPNLSRALVNYNSEKHKKAVARGKKYYNEALALKEEIPAEVFHSFYDRDDIIVRRADSVVLSLIENCADYMGGVHGMYGYFGVNFDTETGKQLQISDVCTNAENLLKAIMMRLHEDYPRSPFETAETYVMEHIVQDTLNFTIDPAGITVYFNPYEIGCYAEGLFTTTLLFSEYPNLFKDKYKQLPKAYCETLPLYGANIVSFGNGLRNYIQVNIDEKGFYQVFTGGGTAEDKTDLKGLKDPVLVHMANGKNYLYVDGYIEGKGRELHVYNISDKNLELVWVLPCTFKDMNGLNKYETWWILTDPDRVRFYSREPIEAGGTPMNHFGAINTDGSFSFG